MVHLAYNYVNKYHFFYRNIPNYVELSIVKGEQPPTHHRARTPANKLSHDVTTKMAVNEQGLFSRCKPDVVDDVTKNVFESSHDNFSNYLSVSTWSSRVTAV